VAYFASWIPWLKGLESDEIVPLLGPYLTPMLVFVGVATLGRSWLLTDSGHWLTGNMHRGKPWRRFLFASAVLQ